MVPFHTPHPSHPPHSLRSEGGNPPTGNGGSRRNKGNDGDDNRPNHRPDNDDDDNRPGDGGGDFNWRGVLLIVMAVSLLGYALSAHNPYGTPDKVPFSEFKELITKNEITKDKPLTLLAENGRTVQRLEGEYADAKAHKSPQFRVEVVPLYQRTLLDDLEATGYKVNIKDDRSLWDSPLVSLLPFILLMGILFFFFRQQIRMAGKGAMNFGKSKAKMLTREKNRITFKDVAGVDEAKDEVEELVEFLKDPKKFQKLGGRIPKGVLLVGPPGTGKTLLARAIAGEADVPFFSISGSDFVEMFVGVGASRVRDMFEQGKKNAPCIIFIDEIDAVGRHRGQGLGGGHDEREQTLNALLVEMDGFDTQEGVIIIAATNRPDVLDPALLRPGRFDRQITVNLPDVKGREQILKVHARKVKLAAGVDLGVVARGTPGYSGAELANVINEAALMAARRGQKAITLAELEEARDKVRWGRERRSLAMSAKEKEIVAYHEAGHALLCELVENMDPLHKVTIIPRGPALGLTMYLPLEDRYLHRRKEFLDDLVMTMGGRVAEEITFGDVTNGASGDIRQASSMARRMVCEWGMSEGLGMVEYGQHQEHVFLGRSIGQDRNYSEQTAQEIDREVRALCDNAYARATALLSGNRDKLEAIAKALLEYETLDGSQIKEIIKDGVMSNPPPLPGSGGPGGSIGIPEPATEGENPAPPRMEPPPHPGITLAPDVPAPQANAEQGS